MTREPANILNGPTNINGSEKILGVDESGKGDFFGPLVIAGVVSDKSGADNMLRAGVKDSKKISDGRILELSRWIKTNFVHSIVIIGPEKYNELYGRIRNLNKLLAWGHSRVIENIALENDIGEAISDKFGHSDLIEKSLMEKGRALKLSQFVRAEEIPQVAAASVMARAGFIQYMEKLSSLYGMTLPKGAGEPVDKAALIFVRKYGPDALVKVAKLHFRNYRKITG